MKERALAPTKYTPPLKKEITLIVLLHAASFQVYKEGKLQINALIIEVHVP